MKYPIELIETAFLTSKEIPSFEKENSYTTTANLMNKSNLSKSSDYQSINNNLPVQIMNKVVLKFTGFFKETVFESRIEEFRVRHLDISLFIEDNSISIREPKQKNSGMMQGIFLKRQFIYSENQNRNFNAYDFIIGNTVKIAGREIQITSCDQFTREFYRILKVDQKEDFKVEKDNFENTVLADFGPKTNCGLNSFLNNGHVPSQKQFLENDRKVLRFYASFENEPYLVHYYLSDDSIEVCSVKVLNSGKLPCPVFLARQKVAKEYKLGFTESLKSEDCINFGEIFPFQILRLLNKPYFIMGCDLFTREFYKSHLSVQFPVYKNEGPVQIEKLAQAVPPSNGFGTDEDSLQNVLKLVPKPPKKDYFSLMDLKGKLQFVAKLITEEDINKQRLFNEKVYFVVLL